jgi:NADH dehydrogenase [ubiquinone] 1 alpha subcomplex assembly factor 1
MSVNLPIENRLVIDFLDPAQTLRWTPVNDRVMGGVSTSQATATAEGMDFSGLVSLDNNGGFASIRALPSEYCLAGAIALVLRVRGDGRTYKFGIRTDDAYDGVQYQIRFATQIGEWQDIRLPINEFQPSFRGSKVQAPALDLARIRVFGLLISDRQCGPFRLVVESIQAQF